MPLNPTIHWPDLGINDKLVFAAFIPEIPPSLNKLRLVARNRIITSAEGRAYRRRCYDWLNFFFKDSLQISSDDPLRLDFLFYLPRVENKGWPGKAKRFKKKDVSNLVKLIEDTLILCLNKQGLDIDDAQCVKHTQEKTASNFSGVLLCLSKTTLRQNY